MDCVRLGLFERFFHDGQGVLHYKTFHAHNKLCLSLSFTPSLVTFWADSLERNPIRVGSSLAGKFYSTDPR
jgi:hypothetical protein